MHTFNVRACCLLLTLLLAACSDESASPPVSAGPGPTSATAQAIPEAQFVGAAACADCHDEVTRRHAGSHHDLAMQPATAATVLGDFDDARFEHQGQTSRFYRDNDRFMVRTEGADGELQDFEISHVFGVDPLQQVLVPFPGGRLQALTIAWDTRPAADGGQRWFHLYPDETITADDELHWTSVNHNWNYMCAECHSTNLRKNYDVASGTYDTRYAEINVSCEACHGPASRHVSWARGPKSADDADKGLVGKLIRASQGSWAFTGDSPIAVNRAANNGAPLIDTCGQCHSRRTTLNLDQHWLKPLADTHLVSALEPGLYHSDGQVLDEVYVYGSFLQSKMHAAGVTCSDCHDPHSLNLKAPADGVCLQCHKADTFAVTDHHHHKPGSPGSACVDCHMPMKNFMVVDGRRDHSFRVPQPELDTPLVCESCHDASRPWFTETISTWRDGKAAPDHFGDAFARADNGLPGATDALLGVLIDPEQPAIVRASTIARLGSYLNRESFGAINQALNDPDPMVRREAIRIMTTLPGEARAEVLGSLLADPALTVRTEAAVALAGVTSPPLSRRQVKSRDKALAEYEAAQRENADRAFAHTNLGNLYATRGELAAAEAAYRHAIELEPYFAAAYLNLADLKRREGDEAAVMATLQDGLDVTDAPVLHHALGLSLVRQSEYDRGIESLRRAWELDPVNPTFGLVYGIALDSVGEQRQAIAVLEAIREHSPENARVLMTLTSIYREAGQIDKAIEVAETLVTLDPQDPERFRLLQALQTIR